MNEQTRAKENADAHIRLGVARTDNSRPHRDLSAYSKYEAMTRRWIFLLLENEVEGQGSQMLKTDISERLQRRGALVTTF